MIATRLSFAALAVGFAAAVTAADPRPDPREKLETAIPEAIRLLEAREYRTFIEQFAVPDELKQVLGQGTIEELTRSFAKENAQLALRVMKQIVGARPTLEADGTRATFELKEAVEGKKSITFVKIGKYWYLRNN
jgi:hypothetical protein